MKTNYQQASYENKMLVYKKKSKVMNFNFTKNFQFSSRLSIENEVLETISETKLLGVIINDKLSWVSNTSYLVKRAISRMRMLHKLVEFKVPVENLITSTYYASDLSWSSPARNGTAAFPLKI